MKTWNSNRPEALLLAVGSAIALFSATADADVPLLANPTEGRAACEELAQLVFPIRTLVEVQTRSGREWRVSGTGSAVLRYRNGKPLFQTAEHVASPFMSPEQGKSNLDRELIETSVRLLGDRLLAEGETLTGRIPLIALYNGKSDRNLNDDLFLSAVDFAEHHDTALLVQTHGIPLSEALQEAYFAQRRHNGFDPERGLPFLAPPRPEWTPEQIDSLSSPIRARMEYAGHLPRAALKLARSTPARPATPGETVYAIGFAREEYRFAQGTMTALKGVSRFGTATQIARISIDNGMSGGLLCAYDGQAAIVGYLHGKGVNPSIAAILPPVFGDELLMNRSAHPRQGRRRVRRAHQIRKDVLEPRP